MLCPKCNQEISDNSKFCSNCGTNIKEYLDKLEEEKYIKCPNCDKKIEKDAKFCRYCGYDILNKENTDVQKSPKGISLGNHVAIATVLLIIFVSFSIVFFSIKEYYIPQSRNIEPKQIEQPQATIEVVNSRLVNMGYGMQKIEGIVKNTSSTTCFNPNVEIYTFDSAGNRVGEHPVLMNPLNPEETYKFTIYDNGVSRYSVETCNCRY